MTLSQLKLAPTQWQIIWALYFQGSLTQKELMDRTNVPELASISKHLSVLRKLGFVVASNERPQRYVLIKEHLV